MALFGTGPLIIVDDNWMDIQLATASLALSELRKEVLPLESGYALIGYLDAARANKRALPSLVLLDVNMPDINGFEVLEHVRRMRGFEVLPLVSILSSSDDPGDVARAAKLGAPYFAKPSSLDKYVSLFDKLGKGTPDIYY